MLLPDQDRSLPTTGLQTGFIGQFPEPREEHFRSGAYYREGCRWRVDRTSGGSRTIQGETGPAGCRHLGAIDFPVGFGWSVSGRFKLCELGGVGVPLGSHRSDRAHPVAGMPQGPRQQRWHGASRGEFSDRVHGRDRCHGRGLGWAVWDAE